MDHLSSSLRGMVDPSRATQGRPRSERAGAPAEPTDSPAPHGVRDEAILHPTAPFTAPAETMADMHKKVDLPDDDAVARKAEADLTAEGDGLQPPRDEAEASERMQPQLAQKSRGLVSQTILQRTQGRPQPGGQEMATAEAEATVNDARLLADGVVPSMMEGLLNQVHRNKDKRDKKDSARLLLIILKAHGAYVYEHCTRLVDLAMSLARELGEGGEQLDRQVEDGLTYRDVGEVAFFLTKRSARQRDALAAYLGGVEIAQDAVLHDLGKIQVPEEVLYKPGPLNPDERRIMERHPVWGAEILEGIPPLHHAIPVTRHHHERYDGQGYPDRVGGEDIPIAARIVCVVDAFDAMVSDRPYRKGLPLEEVVEIIRQGAGTQFDPRVAAAFLRIVDKVWSPDRQY